jgi:hypothetical protein
LPGTPSQLEPSIPHFHAAVEYQFFRLHEFTAFEQGCTPFAQSQFEHHSGGKPGRFPHHPHLQPGLSKEVRLHPFGIPGSLQKRNRIITQGCCTMVCAAALFLLKKGSGISAAPIPGAKGEYPGYFYFVL